MTMKSGKLGSSGNEISFSKEVCHRSRGIHGECGTIFATSIVKIFDDRPRDLSFNLKRKKERGKYVAESKMNRGRERERKRQRNGRRDFRVVTLLIHIVRLLRACRAGHLKVDNYLGRRLQSSILKEIDSSIRNFARSSKFSKFR